MNSIPDSWRQHATTTLDFIVVGSGAGGGPLAARLAERGYQVLVLEMGPAKPAKKKSAVVENTDVPLLHPETTEDDRHSLRYFVKHHDHDPESSLDPKLHRVEEGTATDDRDEQGIFYPRAQGIGGCTLHNAMITICGPPEDWDEIAEATGDSSWRGEAMRAYFERIERCHYDQPRTLWGKLKALLGWRTGWRDGRHGHRGWLDTTMASTQFLRRERLFLKTVLHAAAESVGGGSDHVAQWIGPLLKGRPFPGLDPNHWQTMRKSQEGLTQIPTSITPTGRRSSVRDRIHEVQNEYPDRLHVQGDALITKVLLDDDTDDPTAIGVDILFRPHAYQADPRAQDLDREIDELTEAVYCRREVILCGGTFNTPQLLMLSGIGPREQLQQHGVDVRVDRSGVGCHLQDRYEVPVIATLSERFKSLDGLSLTSHGDAAEEDACLQDWIREEPGVERNMYSTNGGLIGLMKRSAQEPLTPDLFMFALAGSFPGYYVGWSAPSALAPNLSATDSKSSSGSVGPSESASRAADHKRTLSWLVLKARTRHREGYVRLRDANPLRRPEINFRSFPDLNDDQLVGADPDLEAIFEGVQTVKAILGRGVEKGVIESFHLPGLDEFDGDERRWIRHIAWGHHAAGTCRVGSVDDRGCVLDSRLRVRGTRGLRVVDASVFPKIPGYFIVTNVYMVSEKAADMLTEDHPLGDQATDVTSPLLRSSPAHRQRLAYPAEFEAAEAALIRQRRELANVDPATKSQVTGRRPLGNTKTNAVESKRTRSKGNS